MQAPLNGCRCEPLINKLENQLEATKEEMKTEINAVQDLMNIKIGQLDHSNKHQMRALEKMTLERMWAEKSQCQQRIEQKAVQERQECHKQQESLVTELKSWCLSKLQNMNSSSCVTHTLTEDAGLTVKSAPQTGASGTKSADPSPSYLLVHEDTSAGKGDLEVASGPVVRPKQRTLLSPMLQRKDLDLSGPGLTRRHRASSLDRSKSQRRNSQSRTKTKGGVEACADQPVPSYEQDKDNVQAVKVTQYFFETVSTQMERWYERKLREARQQAEQKAQADRAALLDRITHLEDELRLLRADKHC